MLLETAGAATVTDVDLFSILTDIETIDFTGAGIDADLNLDLADVQGVTDGNNRLEILINASGDSVVVTGDNGSPVTGGGTTTYTFEDGGGSTLAELLVTTV